MTYQKPVTSQRFDKPVYQLQQPKKKTEKKRPFVMKTQRADDQGQTGTKQSLRSTKPDESIKSKKPARSTKSLVSKKPSGMKKATRSAGSKKPASGKKRQSSVKSPQPATARRRRA